MLQATEMSLKTLHPKLSDIWHYFKKAFYCSCTSLICSVSSVHYSYIEVIVLHISCVAMHNLSGEHVEMWQICQQLLVCFTNIQKTEPQGHSTS